MAEQTEVKQRREAYELVGRIYERPAKRRIEDVDTEFILQVPGYAVAKELDRKRRLGFDAIIVENDTIMRLHPDGSMTEDAPVEVASP